MEDRSSAVRVREELADVFIYLLHLADVMGVDLRDAVG
jgi:NTP pyrophosphatase (non-canonical NTP hydrolase)